MAEDECLRPTLLPWNPHSDTMHICHLLLKTNPLVFLKALHLSPSTCCFFPFKKKLFIYTSFQRIYYVYYVAAKSSSFVVGVLALPMKSATK